MFTIVYDDTGKSIHPDFDHAYTKHMTTARRLATEAAVASGRAIRIDAAGRPRLVIRPDGGAEPPATARRAAGCTAGQGGGACFCPNCRAARRR